MAWETFRKENGKLSLIRLSVSLYLIPQRYVNMDYLVQSALRLVSNLDIALSYDISCQWSINLFPRFNIYGSEFDIRQEGRTFKFLIPKFHLPAHKEACQTTYSFNFNEGVGRTDGEGIERGWDNINPIATSTREMGPGARRDHLDHILNDHNWVKVTRMGEYRPSPSFYPVY